MALELKHLTTQMHEMATKGIKVAGAAIDEISRLRAENAELKAENERLKKCEIWMKQHFYCEEVIACESAKNRRLKRSLWLARANRALEKIAWFKLWDASISTMNPEDGARQEFDKWKKNLGKFLKKAEEYR